MIPRLALLAALVLLPAAPAAAWTRPAGFATGLGEPVPRAAIAPDGASAVAFQTRRGLEVVTGDARGRFGAPRLLDRRRPRDWSVAASTFGRVLVAWEQSDGIHVAVRA